MKAGTITAKILKGGKGSKATATRHLADLVAKGTLPTNFFTTPTTA
jgi:hypothetical protein